MKNISDLFVSSTKLWILCMVMVGVVSCARADKEEDRNEDDAEEWIEEDSGRAWRYQVQLKQMDVTPGAEHLGGTLKFNGLALLASNGDYIAYDDDVDYQYYVREFLFAYGLAENAELETETEWQTFTADVLDKTVGVTGDTSCLNEISNPQWREKAKKRWYDKGRDMPIAIDGSRYGVQSFKYPIYYPLDAECTFPFKVKRASADNEYGLPEGAVILSAALW